MSIPSAIIENAREIGVIADTHGLLRLEALTALQGTDLILHAGDIGKPEVLAKLGALAPVVAVRGNVDCGPWADSFPELLTLRIGGTLFLLLHRLADRPVLAAEAPAVVVYGHSHRPALETIDGVLHCNPGSAGPRRFRLPVAVARLRRDGSRWTGQIIELPI